MCTALIQGRTSPPRYSCGLLTRISFTLYRYREKKTRYGDTPNPVYAVHCIYNYEPDDYEVDEDDVQLLKEIGNGHFGKVTFEGVKVVVWGGRPEVMLKCILELFFFHC